MVEVPEIAKCTFNQNLSCVVVMYRGNGHCCKEYDLYDYEVKKLKEASVSLRDTCTCRGGPHGGYTCPTCR